MLNPRTARPAESPTCTAQRRKFQCPDCARFPQFAPGSPKTNAFPHKPGGSIANAPDKADDEPRAPCDDRLPTKQPMRCHGTTGSNNRSLALVSAMNTTFAAI